MNGHERALPEIVFYREQFRLSSQPQPEKRLDSWKEIAAFFERDERTVRRWETERGLPIHRVPGSSRGVVFAYTNELEEWLRRPESAKVETIGADSNAANVGPALVPGPEADSTRPDHPRTSDQESSDQEIGQSPEKQTADVENLRPHSQLLP